MLRPFWTTDLLIVSCQIHIVGEQFANHGCLVIENRISTIGTWPIPWLPDASSCTNSHLSRFGTLIISAPSSVWLFLFSLPIGFH